MTPEIAVLLAILAAALVLLAWGRHPADLVALLVLAALILARLVSLQQAVAGFGHPAVITIAAVFVLGAGLEETGAIGAMARGPLAWARGRAGLLPVVMLSAAVASALAGGTLVVAALLPVVLAASARRGASPSGILVPLAVAVQLGGVCTLIGSTTNLLVSAIAERAGLEPLGMFELAPVGMLLVASSIAYFLVGGRRLLFGGRSVPPHSGFRLAEYVAELRVHAGSPLVGRTVRDVRLVETHGVRVLQLLRGGRRTWFPERERIEVDDHLLVRGAVADLVRLEGEGRLELLTDPALSERLESGECEVVEALVAPRSRLVGRTLRGLFFRHRYRVAVLAMRRGSSALHEALTGIPLRLGDSLLLYGPPEEIQRLRGDDDFLVLREPERAAMRPRRAVRAAGVVAGVVVLVSLGVVPVLVAALLGCVALVLLRCLSLDVAYRAIDWRVIVVLGALLPFTAALERWGAARWLAEHAVAALGAPGPLALLALVYVAAVGLAEGTGADVATVLVAPLALAVAECARADPRPFLVAVAFAAAASFATPRGHPANALAHGAGGYRGRDLARVGLPLNALCLALTLLVVPRLWSF